jgi:hypothetical protein
MSNDEEVGKVSLQPTGEDGNAIVIDDGTKSGASNQQPNHEGSHEKG